MGKLIFKYTGEERNREATSIEMIVPDDMNIGEYKTMCVRMAHAMGFSEKTITKEFGNLIFGNDKPHDIKQLLNEIKSESNFRGTEDTNFK